MWRFMLTGSLFLSLLSAFADDPQEIVKKPPYTRLLKGEDAKKATDFFKGATGLALCC